MCKLAATRKQMRRLRGSWRSSKTRVMKVILLKDVRSVGQHGEVKSVADGYALNFLFPKKLAEPATEEKIRQLEARKKAHEAEALKGVEALTNKVMPPE